MAQQRSFQRAGASAPDALAARLFETRAPVARAGGAAQRRGHGGPADGRRQPDQVAPGARHLVLRDLHSAPSTCRATAIFDDALQLLLQLLLRERRARVSRGPSAALLTRPSSERVLAYRAHVDAALRELFARGVAAGLRASRALIELGINHEQQHQELLLTDILALFAANPLRPAYRRRGRPRARSGEPEAQRAGSTIPAASARSATTATASPGTTSARATTLLIHPFRLADRLVTNAEWLEFMADGGYRNAVALARRRLGHRQPRGLAGAALLGGARRRSGSRCRSTACSRSIRAAPVCPRQLLRGRRLRALGRQAPADRVRVGGRGRTACPCAATRSPRARCGPLPAPRPRDRQAAPDVRRRLGMDRRAPTCPIPGYRAARGRARRVQRQVHGQPAGAARRLVRHARRATRARPIATSSTPTSAGSSSACASPRRSPDADTPTSATCLPERFALDDATSSPRPSSTACRGRSKTLPCRFFYDARGSELFEEITRLPEYYPTRTETRDPRRPTRPRWPAAIARRRRAGRVRLRLEPQDRDPAASGCRSSRAYVPIDVSQSALDDAKLRLAAALSRPSTCGRSSATSPTPSRCRPTSRAATRPASSPARRSAT